MLSKYFHSLVGHRDYKSEGNILLDENNAIYLYIPKVACSSIKQALSKELDYKGGSNYSTNSNVHQRKYPYVNRSDILRKYHKYTRFAFVRNPWDRLYSCYVNKVGRFRDGQADIMRLPKFVHEMLQGRDLRYLTFERFVEMVCDIDDCDANGHFRSQASFLTDSNGSKLYNWVGRFESLADDYSRLAETLLFHDGELPHLLKSSRERNYTDFYNDKTIDLVRVRYKEDIELFGYTFQ